MPTLFLFCAVVGGTIMVCQFLLTLAGLGGHGLDVDHGTDVAHDFAHDAGGHDAHGGDAEDHAVGHAHYSTWLFGVLTFRTLVAAVAFFGIGGMAARAAEMSLPNQLLTAVVAGAAALCLVHWMMRTLYRLGEDGTVRINRAVGLEGTVYVPVPADRTGAGKIQLRLQDRLMEYEAVTAEAAPLPTGAKVVVVGVVGASTLEVVPAQKPAAAETHA
jgi:membrane protein implicated in regulation of membrane protease activity